MNERTRVETDDAMGANAWVVDEMRSLWAADPASVDEAWRALFEGRTADTPAPAPAAERQGTATVAST